MENKKLNVKMIYTVIGIASLTAAFVCVVVLAVKQYRLWKSGQMYEKLADCAVNDNAFRRGYG